jgi:oligopeptide transport system permease protein
MNSIESAGLSTGRVPATLAPIEIARRFSHRRIALLSAALLVLIVVLAFSSDLWLARGYADQDPLVRNQPPLGDAGLLGTDQLGRDLLARLMFGIRLSVAAAAFGVLVQLAVGVPLGLLAGYRGGWIDSVAMRSVDVMLAVPGLLIALLIGMNIKEQVASGSGAVADVLRSIDRLTAGLTPVFVVLVVFFWVSMARIVRGETRVVMARDFVRAARGLGAGPFRIVVHHVLRNCIAPITVSVALLIPVTMLTEAAMSLVGVGVDPPRPSLGVMIYEGAQQINSFPYQTLVPSITFAVVVLLVGFVGDGLRAALDPTTEQGH